MFESWYQRREKKTEFWLDFQVVHDGLEQTTAELAHNATRTFHPFPLLPAELRLKIWEYLIQPRVVAAACFNSHFADQKHVQLAQRPRRRPVPILLHICHETRALAQNHYELTFAWKTPYRLAAERTRAIYLSAPPRVWFNFGLDALLLLGELEPFDQDGFNAPMAHFLRREDTARVRHVACAFEELHLGVYESELIFGCLFHIVDRFATSRLVITTTQRDVKHQQEMLPGKSRFVADNVIQKLWWAWVSSKSSVRSALAGTKILMMPEEELGEFILAGE
ncbi:hypothetical protein B0T17DRAFT_497428 [Bombardia bombarda]|uniref:2EXR domain-containing protein n=1 Tax=Bombardia bombarda TaxID=252184 RepID=A0AA40BW30_9PEZI|nr:hypothetical protein B0T17DRAFT_497428 [Bombardia bombarda]